MCSQELVAVAVDVLDPHRGDHLPQLAEDDFLGLLADLRHASGRAGGSAAFCITSGLVPMATVNTLGTLTRMFSDRQRAAQRHLDLDRLQAQVGVVLDQRPDERRRRRGRVVLACPLPVRP